MKLAKSCIKENAVLIIYNSDIAKPCSKKLEALSEVRDGSTVILLISTIRGLK
ncbi:MAG: hypothetical protein ACYDG2_19515 [Ruminiclostridium sp.]